MGSIFVVAASSALAVLLMVFASAMEVRRGPDADRSDDDAIVAMLPPQ
jgi:hypothetical protein